MNTPEPERLMNAARELLGPAMRDSPAVRRFVESLAQWMLAEVEAAREPSSPDPAAASPTDPPGDASAPNPARPDQPHASSSRAIVPLKIGDAVTHLQVEGDTADIGRARQAAELGDDEQDASHESPSEIELGLIVERCRLKAASCRLFIDRRAAEGDHDREREIVPTMNRMIAQAKATRDCFLWVFWRERTPPDDESLRNIARCYDALADAADLLAELEAAPDTLVQRDDTEAAFAHFAHASAALRCALEHTWLTSADADQDESHAWLRRETGRRGIYLPRYMSLDDRPEEDAAETVLGDVAALRSSWEERRRAHASVKQAFNQIAYHAKKVVEAGAHPDTHDLTRITESLGELDALGVKPSDPRLRRAIPAAVIAEIRGNDSPYIAALADSHARSAAEEIHERDREPATREWSGQVHAVRAMLEGTRVIVIGGEQRQDAIARMKDAFALREVEWISLKEHASAEPIRAPIARDDTALVLVLVKLAGHHHVDEARQCAARADRPLVMLTAGYNPEQIADAVLAQVSDRLSAT